MMGRSTKTPRSARAVGRWDTDRSPGRHSRRSFRAPWGRPTRLLPVALLLGIVLASSTSRAETLVLGATRDATLIESEVGDVANGSGPALFAGRNAGQRGSRRRALLTFDVASALPAGAWVTSVELELALAPSNPDTIELGLHRVEAGWSEGPSRAGGGGGAPAEPGDATWLHRRYPFERWAEPGGDFALDPSAVATVTGPGLYVWGSTPALVADVAAWLHDPDTEHGWILVGGEAMPQTAKRFASRESVEDVLRPRLVVEYATSCDGLGLPPDGLGLCRAVCEVLQCARPHGRGASRACPRLEQLFERRVGGPAPCR